MPIFDPMFLSKVVFSWRFVWIFLGSFCIVSPLESASHVRAHSPMTPTPGRLFPEMLWSGRGDRQIYTTTIPKWDYFEKKNMNQPVFLFVQFWMTQFWSSHINHNECFWFKSFAVSPFRSSPRSRLSKPLLMWPALTSLNLSAGVKMGSSRRVTKKQELDNFIQML